MNRARIQFFGLFILALCTVQTVNFQKLANAFESKTKTDSTLRRIQRYFADYQLDINIISQLIFTLLPEKPPYKLLLDRTHWKFAGIDFNILMIAVVYKGVAIPLLFSMIPKAGNSSTEERIALFNRYISLFSKETIDCLIADREFVGKDWFKYLKDKKINHFIRIKENTTIKVPDKKKTVYLRDLFYDMKLYETRTLNHSLLIHTDIHCYISASKILDKNGQPALQIIASLDKSDLALMIYKERWQIETAFKALKSSGFNIEETHLTDTKRLEKLLALVMVAFIWVYKVGDQANTQKPIPIKKHGRRAISIFKHGLNIVAKILIINDLNETYLLAQFLSCT
jgi:hypothetical protein